MKVPCISSDTKPIHLLEVAVPRLLFSRFTYSSEQEIPVGVRVKVPFASKAIVGMVVNNKNIKEGDYKIKPILSVLDEMPILNAQSMTFLNFIAKYYQYPIGEVIAAALPNALLKGQANVYGVEKIYQITAAGREALHQKLGAKQSAVLQALNKKEDSAENLKNEFGASATWLSQLEKKNWVSHREVMKLPKPNANKVFIQLTEQQEKIAQELSTKTDYSVNLLEGVTGSGKTEVYIKWIEKIVAEGGQVLLLAPEIAIAILLVQRLNAQLSVHCVLYHSEMAEREKLNAWHAADLGKASVMVGTRSALFAQFKNLRAIIVDESHDLTYKQQNGLQYHAVDMAIVRAKMLDIPILLGSATPSLSSYEKVEKGLWNKYVLDQRVMAAKPPKVTIDNIQLGETIDGLSVRLINEIRQCMNRDQQVMLFLNRRGYAPVLQCKECGWQAQCDACDVLLTAHLNERKLICHHCGHQEKIPTACPKCHQVQLLMIGLGTQRLEQTIKKHFPKANTIRMDSDNLTTAKQFQSAVEQIKNNKVDIILGTQWLSKGHHFPNLHLVAVIDVDQSLFSNDFRAEERLAQMLVQVGGRAGREDSGHIWIQSRQVQHPVFQVLNMPYADTAKRLLEERKSAGLPPYSAQVIVYARHKSLDKALLALQHTKQGFKSAEIQNNWLWLGPIPSLMPKRNHMHRAHILIQSKDRKSIQKDIAALNSWLQAQGKALNVRVGMDIDPQFLD